MSAVQAVREILLEVGEEIILGSFYGSTDRMIGGIAGEYEQKIEAALKNKEATLTFDVHLSARETALEVLNRIPYGVISEKTRMGYLERCFEDFKKREVTE